MADAARRRRFAISLAIDKLPSWLGKKQTMSAT